MKILVVTQFFEPENFRINDLIEELDGRGHEITVLTGLPNYPEGSFYEGFSYSSIGKTFKGKIKVVRSPIIPRFSSKKIQLAINYLSFAFFAFIGSSTQKLKSSFSNFNFLIFSVSPKTNV